jgi:hypothetical protein
VKTKKTNLIPLEKRTLTLQFDSEDDMEQWIEWYGKGADLDSSYQVDLDRSVWAVGSSKIMHLVGDVSRCPECKSANYLDIADPDEAIQRRVDFHGKGMNLKKRYLCEDCHHNYNVEEDE